MLHWVKFVKDGFQRLKNIIVNLSAHYKLCIHLERKLGWYVNNIELYCVDRLIAYS